MPKFLDEHGLAYLGQQIKSYVDQSSQSIAYGGRHLGQGRFDISDLRKCHITPPDEFNPYTKQMLHICLFVENSAGLELGDITFVYDNTDKTHNMFVYNEAYGSEGSIGLSAKYINNELIIECNEHEQDWGTQSYPNNDQYIVADVYGEEFCQSEITTDELLLV